MSNKLTLDHEQILSDALVKCNCLLNDNTQIRIYGGECSASYWIMRRNGRYYIASLLIDKFESEVLPMPIIPGQAVYNFVRDGVIIAKAQFLKNA